MKKSIVETVLGAVVLVVAGGFLAFAFKTTDLKPSSGYELNVRYTSHINGLKTGSEVRIKGVKVGKVLKTTLQQTDDGSFQVMVRINVKEGITLPLDTSAKISSESLLGGKYLALTPGADMLMLEPGDTIEYAASAANLEEILSKAVAGMATKSE